MSGIWKNDIYRLLKSPVFFVSMAFSFVLPFALTMILRQDINIGIGISGFNEPTIIIFREMQDIIRMGIQYHTALGVFVAIVVSVFIGQEYQWNTWQHKWIIGKNRTHIYLSKVVVSCITSAMLFVLFQLVVLLFSGQMGAILSKEYAVLMISGIFVYTALGAVICMVSMLIKNFVVSIVTSLIIVMFSENLLSLIGNISGSNEITASIGSWIIRHSIYGMAIRASEVFTITSMGGIVANSLIIVALSTCIGLLVFRRYDL